MPVLTDISLRALKPPPSGQKTYSDDTLPGFGVRVSQGGTRSFVVVFGRTRERVTIGRYPIISLSEARTEAKRILAEHTLGKTRPKSVPFDSAKALFIAACEQRNRRRTVADYKRLLKHFPFGQTPLLEITKQDIVKRLDRLHDTPSEQKHALVAAKIFFRWALRRGQIEHNPCESLSASPSPSRERVLTDKEIVAVYRTALACEDAFSFIVTLLVLTGQRRGEIAALRWDWIDPLAKTITFPTSITKNKRTHVLPYGTRVAMVLERIPRTGDYLFPASREHVRGKLTTIFNGWPKSKIAFDKLCGVSDYQLHDLRRTFSTGMAALGVSQTVVEKLLNHISGGTQSPIAQVYNRFQYANEMRQALTLWEEHLTHLVERLSSK